MLAKHVQDNILDVGENVLDWRVRAGRVRRISRDLWSSESAGTLAIRRSSVNLGGISYALSGWASGAC